jgi:hypothetical protein
MEKEAATGNASLGADLMIGAGAIAAFLFGDPKKRRKIYYLAHQLPVFRMGTELCARKSTLLQHFEEQERAAARRDSATA